MLFEDLEKEIGLLGASKIKVTNNEAHSPIGKIKIERNVFKVVDNELNIYIIVTNNFGVKQEFSHEDPQIKFILESKVHGEKVRIFYKNSLGRFMTFLWGRKKLKDYSIQGGTSFKSNILNDVLICNMLERYPLILYSQMKGDTFKIVLIPLIEEVKVQELYVMLKQLAKFII